MYLCLGFTKFWQEREFRSQVQAVIIDEAHCIVEWVEDFWKEYGGLTKLHDYIGHDIPIFAAMVTCNTETFNVIWKSLKFGCRPFWGLDVRTD
ncbi:hypothetical protein C8R45DRAFT_850691 [Mycena sanguinolenta]|nr:hypothetical protein C8R45DRAFT_850691 [Mycena sanguinolenta]